MASTIPTQIKLPLSVALEVVLQGIRIRLGRSIVTITGVLCGIAFLMSMLTGQIVKKGVASEDARREEVDRIRNFIKAELPNLEGKTVALLGNGLLSQVELRVIARLAGDRVAGLVAPPGTTLSPRPPQLRQIEAETLQREATVVLVMGDGPLPVFDWQAFLATNLNGMVATTRSREAAPPVPADHLVLLSRDLTQEELAKQAIEAGKERFRSIWIGVISLLVTVIGISNAMLMSVTERFREIGTMKCLGSLSSFIRQIFILESSLMGLVGGLAGAVAGVLFSLVVYTFTYGFGLVFAALNLPMILLFGLISVFAGVVLSIIAALYPAWYASGMVPATALRSTV